MKIGISLFALALAIGSVGLRSAHAFSIELTPLTPTVNNGVWNYGYTMTLSAQNAIDSQSFFVYYDVASITSATFTPGATAAADWLILPELTTPNWSGGFSSIVSAGGTIVLPDDNRETNIRYQYVGAGLASGAAAVTLGEAHIFSTQAPSQTTLFYGARWTDGFSGVTNVNTDTPFGPGPAGGNPPEPASLGILGAGVLGLLMRRRH